MIEFIRSIMEDKYGVKMVYTYGDEAKWPAENAEHNTDYMYPEIEYTYDRSSGAARNELLLDYIRELGYDVDFKTSLAKLEKDSTGRITGIIAQSTEMTTSSATTPTRAFCWPAAASPATPT